MDIKGHFDNDLQIVVVECEALINRKNFQRAMTEGHRVAVESNCTEMFFDLYKCPIDQSLIEAFLMMKDIRKTTGVSSKYRLAALINSNTFPASRARFIENVVNNRSNPRVLFFTRQEEAVAWLHMGKSLDIQSKDLK